MAYGAVKIVREFDERINAPMRLSLVAKNPLFPQRSAIPGQTEGEGAVRRGEKRFFGETNWDLAFFVHQPRRILTVPE